MSGAYPYYQQPPPGVTVDPLPDERRRSYVEEPPPQGVTVDPQSVRAPGPETSFWRRLAGMEQGPLIPPQTPDQGSLWPVRHTPQGMQFDPYAGLSGMFLRGITSPGDVSRGSVPTHTPTGQINPDLTNRGLDFAQSVSLTNPAAMAGERAFGPPVRTGPSATPSARMLKDTASDQFNDIRLRAPDVLSSTIADRARQTSADLSRTFDREAAGNVFSTLGAMLDPAATWTPMTSLLARRDRLKELAGKGGAEGAAASQALAQVNDLLSTQLGTNNTRPQYAGGPFAPMAPGEVAPALSRADANWGAAQRANQLTGDLQKARVGMVERGEGRRGNLDLNIRNAAERMLENEKQVKSLTPEELRAVEYIQAGNWLRNKASDLGTSFGQSGLSKAVASLRGGAGLGLLGTLIQGLTPEAAVPAAVGMVAGPWVGSVARSVADAGARRAVSAAEELMRRRSALAQEYLAGRTSPLFGREQAIQSILQPGLLGALESYPEAAPPRIEQRLPPGYI